jgi:flagellar biosynthesis chaperone FliJ
MTDAMYHLLREQNDVRHTIADLRVRIDYYESRNDVNFVQQLAVALNDAQSKYAQLMNAMNELRAREDERTICA